jgi:hypothetical protein
MSKELENITGAVMDKIHDNKITMRPRVYFVIGAFLTFTGLVSSVVFSVFLIGLIRFSVRAHGPMGAYRMEQILASFPWWLAVLAIVGLAVGIWLVRRYDFSYKFDFKVVIAGFVLAAIMGGLIVDIIGVNDMLVRKGPMQGMMRHYLQGNSIPQSR